MHSSSLHVGRNHGTPTLHVGTTPGTAGSSSTSGGGTLQPGGFQPGSFRPRRTVNQTVGQLTNHSVPRTSIMRRLKTGGDKYIQTGQFVFTRCGKQPMGGQGGRGSEGIDTLYNLPLMNFYLAHLCTNDQTRVRMMDRTAADIASEFVPHGVVLNSNGNDGENQGERMVVCTVRGFADTFNIWGNKVYDGDSLYFVYKEVQGTDLNEFTYSYDFSGTPAKPAVRHNPGVSTYWQIFPVVCRGDSQPRLADLTDGDRNHSCKTGADSKDKRGRFRGIARCIGRVQHARNSTGSCVMGTPEHAGLSRELILMTNVCKFTIFIDL